MSAAAAPEYVGLDIPAFPTWLSCLDGDETYEWARIQWRRAHAVPGAWFDHVKADKVVALWPRVFTLTEDRFAGLPFRLNAWQEIIVRFLVGFKAPIEITDPLSGLPRSEHVRLFRRMFLWVPRKNGKSEFLAALALLFFAIEGTIGGQGYVFARDEEQARTIFDKMGSMIGAQEGLAADIAVLKKGLWLAKRRAGFKLLSGKAKGKHGKSASVIAGDEMHEWKSREMMDVLRQSTGARLQPMELYASTAGRKSDRTGYQLFEESQKILDGRIDDPTTLVVIFAANDNDDFRSEDAWKRANPSLGISPTMQFLRREAAYANDNPRAEAEFRCYHLNQFIEAHVRWLNLKKWDACAQADSWRSIAERMRGRPCFGGFDVSSTRDVTSLEWLFPPAGDETHYTLLSRFWVPADTLSERVKNDQVDYDKWLASGALETTPGDFVDQNFVKKALLDGFSDFDVQRIGYDSWNASKLVADLQHEGVDPERLMVVRQGIQSLGEPSKMFERMVYAGSLDHGRHPVLRWMAGNAVVRFDENLNFAPAKKRSAEKIDGIVAAVMATAAAMSMDEGVQESVYEKLAREQAAAKAAVAA